MFVTILVCFVGYLFYLSLENQKEAERRRQTPKPTILVENINNMKTIVRKIPSPPRSHKKDSRIAHK